MKASNTLFAALLVLLASPFALYAQYPGYTLDWSDEFNGNSLDLNTWNFEVGDGCPNCGWGNWEQQIYTTDRATVANGELTIHASWDWQNNRIESARINTAGKKTYQEGILEARIKFVNFDPADHNFAAFWSLGESFQNPAIPSAKIDGGSGWPNCGEIDIMEAVSNLDLIGTIHYNPVPDNNNDGLHDAYGWHYITAYAGFVPTWDQYHTYSVERTAGQLIYKFDGIPFGSQSLTDPDKLEFNQPFFVLLNVAIGGTLAGNPPNPQAVDVSMVVDYVRYYRPDQGRIEAENFSLQSGGVQTSTSNNATYVSHLDPGDWMTYQPINLPDGPGHYDLHFRIASANGQGVFQFEKAGGGVVYAQVQAPNTGSWDHFTTLTIPNVYLPGTGDYAIAVTSGGVNIDYLELDPAQQFTEVQVEAENFQVQSGGVQTTTSNGATYVSYLDPGEWMTYEPIDLPDGPGIYELTFRVASASGQGAFQFEKAGGGAVYAQVQSPNTNGWDNFTEVTVTGVNLPGSGNYAIAVQSGGVNIDHIQLRKTGNAKAEPTAESPALTAYPNPARDRVTLKGIPREVQSVDLIHGLTGKVIRRIPTFGEQKLQLDLQELCTGWYFIQTHGTTGVKTIKLVID